MREKKRKEKEEEEEVRRGNSLCVNMRSKIYKYYPRTLTHQRRRRSMSTQDAGGRKRI